MNRKATLGLLVQVLVAFGLGFVGWGLDDPRGFLAHPARAGMLAVALLGLAASLLMRLDIQVFRKDQRPVGRQRWLLPGLMVAGLALMCWLPYADRRSRLTFGNGDALRYFGLLLYAAGAVLALASLRALGKQYSGYVTLQKDHQLVQSGIYGVIRHPIYLRALLVALGLPLVFRSWLVVLLVPLLGLFVALRIRQEEKLLAEQFGEEFAAYQRRTWRLVPYVY